MIGNLGCNDPIKQAVKGIHGSVIYNNCVNLGS